MLSFESYLSNTVDDNDDNDDDDGDDDADGDDDLSEFLLEVTTSRAALGDSWFLDFHHGPEDRHETRLRTLIAC